MLAAIHLVSIVFKVKKILICTTYSPKYLLEISCVKSSGHLKRCDRVFANNNEETIQTSEMLI